MFRLHLFNFSILAIIYPSDIDSPVVAHFEYNSHVKKAIIDYEDSSQVGKKYPLSVKKY